MRTKRTMNKILSWVLTLAMILSMMPGMAFADEIVVTDPSQLQEALENAGDGDTIVLGNDLDLNGGNEAPELPTATVTKIKNDDLTFAMNFKADEVTDEQLAYYGNWYADFELTVNKDVVFNANGGANGYLSGQYDAWMENWVNVPFEDVTLEANESLKVMAYAAEMMGKSGLKLTYGDVYTDVKDFDCGVFFEPEFLTANPDLEVTLELRMYNPTKESESYVIGKTYTYTVNDVAPDLPTATVTDSTNNDSLTFAKNFKADESTEDQLAYYGSWFADFVLTVNKDVTFNANGGADGYLSGQYDAWSKNWVNVPFEKVTLKANEALKVMAYAAEMMNQSGLKLTYNDVYTSVKDFDCGVFFEPKYLANNPDLEVTLELRMYNPADETESYTIGDTYKFKASDVTDAKPALPTSSAVIKAAEEVDSKIAGEVMANGNAAVADLNKETNGKAIDAAKGALMEQYGLSEDVQVVAAMAIELTKVEGDKLTFDVKPMVHAISNNTVVSQLIENKDLVGDITFRLPVLSDKNKNYARVYHDGTLMGLFEIEEANSGKSGKFVKVESKRFSEFAVEPIEVVLPEGVTAANYEELFGTNTVTDGTKYYATLQAAVEAVCGNAGAILYCKPGADVGSLQHAPVTATLTVYGNGAYVSGGNERDFDIGNTDPNGGRDITADMTLTVKYLDGCGAWGAKATEHTVNLVFEGCENMGKVFITGTTGTLNITMTDCAFEGVLPEAVYSNADGAIALTNVDFANLNKAINLNHKAAGIQTVVLKDCTFTDCGNNVANDQIPVRVLSSVKGGKSVLTVSGCTFTGTPEGGADILLDYGVGTTTASVSTTVAKVTVETKDNVGTDTTMTEEDTQSFTNVVETYVAQVGEVKYESVIEALLAAIEIGASEVKLLADSREVMPTDVELLLKADLTITSGTGASVAAKFYNNGTKYDFIFNTATGYDECTLTIGKNVTFQLEDRVIWAGFYGNNVDVVVDGTLAGYQYWHGADTTVNATVNATGTLMTTGEALVLRRGATLTVDGGKVDANYFNILAGNIFAENAEIDCGAFWIANTGSYAGEGNVNVAIWDSTLTSSGNLKSNTTHADGVSIDVCDSTVSFTDFDGYGASVLDANTTLEVNGEDASLTVKSMVNNGTIDVYDGGTFTVPANATVTNNGSILLEAGSTIAGPENMGVEVEATDKEVEYVDGKYVVVDKMMVAQIGDVKYATLQAAIAAAQAGGTVTLLQDITLTQKIDINKNLTLDLNGKTITTSGIVASRVFVLGNGCTEFVLNGNGGKIVSKDAKAYGIIDVNTTADLIVNGGTYDFDTDNGSLFKFRNYVSTITLNEVVAESNGQISSPTFAKNVLDVNGGTFKAENNYNVRNIFAFYIQGATATFDDVTIENKYIGGIECCAGTATVTNCNISVVGTNGSPYLSTAVAVDGCGEVTINGGNYSTRPAAATDANGQGNTHGSWTMIIMSSGGTMTINGGTFSNGVFEGTASHPRAVISVGADADCGDAVAAELQINGGIFNSIGALVDCETIWGSETDHENDYMPTMDIAITAGDFTGVAGKTIGGCDPITTGNPVGIEISGGTYGAKHAIAESYLADGYVVKDNDNGTYGVVEAKTYVAEVNGVKYETLAAAIAAAAERDTVQLLPGEISETINPWGADSTHACEKSITIVGAEDFGTKLTGGLVLGYDDNGSREHTITIEGIVFEGKGLMIAGQKKVVVKNNKFTNINQEIVSSQSAGVNAISVIGKNVNATIEGNTIDTAAASGIHLRDIATAIVTGNTVSNTGDNAITVNKGQSDVDGSITVTNNTLSAWGKSGEGRAIRSDLTAATIKGNVMTHTAAPEQFVKLTYATGTVDVSENYWNGVKPTEENIFVAYSDDGTTALDAVAVLKNYYAEYQEGVLRELVQLELTDANLTFANYLNFASYIGVQFIVDTVAARKYDNVYVVIKQVTPSGEKEVILSDNIGADYGMFGYEIRTVAKEMSDNMTVTVCGVKDGKTYFGETKQFSVKSLAMAAIPTYYNDGNIKVCTLLVDMLNYGAAAQVEFGYGTDNLANAGLNEQYAELATPSVEISKVNKVTGEGSLQAVQVSLGISSMVQLQLIFAQDMSAYEAHIEIDGVAPMVIDGAEFMSAGTYRGLVLDIAAKNMKSTHTISIWEKASNTQVSPTYLYSVEGAATSLISAGSSVNFAVAMMKYGAAAENYFKK